MTNIRDVWDRTTLVQRTMLLAIVLGCAVVASMLVWWARRPNMTLLYTGLAPEEAARVVDKIRDLDTPYELKNGGTTILVPAEKVYSLRLTMAGQGVPRGEQGGYRILDEEKIGASPFTQRVNYIRAIEGELAKSICLIEGVTAARVHVVKPESNIFVGKDKESSATAVICVRSGCKLSPKNVAAIVYLISGSVEGLSPERVVVVDSQGTLLHGEEVNDVAKRAGTFLDYKSEVEDYLARKVQDMLISALGPGRSSVRLDATIDTVSLNSTSETYDPAKRVVTKEEIKSSVASAPADSKAGGGNKEETTSTEYLASRIVEQKAELPGTIKSLTIAAFVDLSPPENAKKEGAPAAPTLTIADIEGVIRNAIGPLATKDNIKVVNTTLYRPPVSTDIQAQQESLSKREFYMDLASRGSLGLLVVGAVLALKIMSGPKKKAQSQLAAAALMPLEAQGGAMAGLLTSEAETDPQVLRARIVRTLQENPEEVKRLFLSWVESDKGEA